MKKILIVDDDVDICLLVSRFLVKNSFEVTTAHSGKAALEYLKTIKFDLILSDFRLGDTDGLELLEKIKEINSSIPVIIITGYSDIKMAVKIIKAGAYDYITKPLLPEEILYTVRRAIESSAIKKEETNNTRIKSVVPANFINNYIIGESQQAKEIYRQIDLVAPTNYSVIIYGESGTGKESVAQTIHARSARRDKPFVAMDCGSITKELSGSELFGHEKGSFTGALNLKIGHFEMANGGTLFLDEVSNLTYETQVSLLRVVQERKVKRIGGTKEIALDVRIIVATNENLYDSCQKGRFREDLYHRFNEFNINVPPLRERNKDIMIFANHFLKLANEELNKNIQGFSEDVIESFSSYQWNGNLREMKNVIKRAALLTNGDLIQSKALPPEIVSNIRLTLSTNYIHTENLSTETKPSLKNVGLEAEYETIIAVLKQVNFNKTKAAQILNIDRKTLYNKMKAVSIYQT